MHFFRILPNCIEYLTEEKFYPLGTTDEYFEAPYEERPITICAQKAKDYSRSYLDRILSAMEDNPTAHGALGENRIKTYLKNSLYPLMYLFGKNSMPDVDNLLTSFYQLDDEARKEAAETIQFKLYYHQDQERAELVTQIKGW